jgi:hypothetical protein
MRRKLIRISALCATSVAVAVVSFSFSRALACYGALEGARFASALRVPASMTDGEIGAGIALPARDKTMS